MLNKIYFNQYYRKIVLVFLTSFFLAGCIKKHDYQEDNLTRVNGLNIVNLEEMKENFYQDIERNDNIIEDLFDYFKFEGEYTEEKAEKSFLLQCSFTSKLVPNETEFDYFHTPLGVVLQPCSLEKIHPNFTDYPVYAVNFLGDKVFNRPNIYVFFSIEKLFEVGYITEDEQSQQDLCLFRKEHYEDMGTKYYRESNDLVYTAEEINEIRAEYERLMQ